MKEIKFRAWNKKEKKSCNKMLKVVSIDIRKKEANTITPLQYKGKRYSYDDFGQIIIMQFTGLKDKNGKEIYEGDILEWYYNSDEEQKEGLGSSFKAKVIFGNIIKEQGSEAYSSNHVGFFCEWLTDEGSEDMQFTDMPIEKMCRIEVIGNIYENPELLDLKEVKK